MPGTVYQFANFTADTSRHTLLKDGNRISIQEQPFQVLLALLACPGQVVTREALRTRLWGTDTFVDFDQSLNSAVRRLRLALEDNSRVPVFIETIPRVGFRFLPEVHTESLPQRPSRETTVDVAHSASQAPALPSPTPDANGARRFSPKLIGTGVLTLTLGVLLGMVPAHWLALRANAAPETSPQHQEAFGAGSNQTAENDAATAYTRESPGFAKESGTPVTVATGQSMRELQGWYHLRQRTQQDYLEARQDFEQALKVNSSSSSALVGLAQTDILLALNGDTPKLRVQEARTEGRRALSLSPHLASAHAVIGAADALADWNNAEAAQEFQTALHLDPHDSLSHLWFAVFVLLPQQNYAAAEREANTAVHEDPLSLIAHTDLGWILYSEGKRSAALEQYRFVLQLNPGFVPAQFRVRQIANQQNDGALKRLLERSATHISNAAATTSRYLPGDPSSICAEITEPDPSLQAVRSAVEQHCSSAYFFGQNPELAKLRSDPGFAALLEAAHPRQNAR